MVGATDQTFRRRLAYLGVTLSISDCVMIKDIILQPSFQGGSIPTLDIRASVQS